MLFRIGLVLLVLCSRQAMAQQGTTSERLSNLNGTVVAAGFSNAASFVLTDGRSLYCFDNSGKQLWRRDFAVKPLCMLAEPDGVIWLGTSTGSLLRLSPAGLVTLVRQLPSVEPVTSLFKLPEELLAAGQGGTLLIVNSALQTVAQQAIKGLLWIEGDSAGAWMLDGEGSLYRYEMADRSIRAVQTGYEIRAAWVCNGDCLVTGPKQTLVVKRNGEKRVLVAEATLLVVGVEDGFNLCTEDGRILRIGRSSGESRLLLRRPYRVLGARTLGRRMLLLGTGRQLEVIGADGSLAWSAVLDAVPTFTAASETLGLVLMSFRDWSLSMLSFQGMAKLTGKSGAEYSGASTADNLSAGVNELLGVRTRQQAGISLTICETTADPSPVMSLTFRNLSLALARPVGQLYFQLRPLYDWPDIRVRAIRALARFMDGTAKRVLAGFLSQETEPEIQRTIILQLATLPDDADGLVRASLAAMIHSKNREELERGLMEAVLTYLDACLAYYGELADDNTASILKRATRGDLSSSLTQRATVLVRKISPAPR